MLSPKLLLLAALAPAAMVVMITSITEHTPVDMALSAGTPITPSETTAAALIKS